MVEVIQSATELDLASEAAGPKASKSLQSRHSNLSSTQAQRTLLANMTFANLAPADSDFDRN